MSLSAGPSYSNSRKSGSRAGHRGGATCREQEAADGTNGACGLGALWVSNPTNISYSMWEELVDKPLKFPVSLLGSTRQEGRSDLKVWDWDTSRGSEQ